MQKLVIQDDEGKTTVVPLIRDEITIGRKEGNTIRLTERNVSRRHARIVRNNGSVVIEDLNSYNGVRVNGSRIQGRCQISMSDRIQIGDYIIELKAEGIEAGVEGYGERTQPMERVDALATTPVPQQAEQGPPTAIVNVNQIQGQPAPASYAPQAFSSTDPGLQPVGDAGPAGRVVILSTNFAGQEYELVKPAMVIGRTEDNDIVVNHRSISRHHAKIVRENGRYAIVDLQSSNGVRVNGEEYGKVELRRGDVVDLGHVRLRFIEPGEDFVFGRDAVAMDIAPQKKSKALVYALLGAAVLAGVVVVALVASGGGGDEEDEVNVAEGGGKTGPDPNPAAGATPSGGNDNPSALKPENGTAPPVNDTGGQSEADQAFAAAETARDAENWAEAKKQAEKARGLGFDDAKVDAIIAQADKEMKNKKAFDAFKKAAATGDVKKADASFDQIDPDSVYKEQARGDYDRIVEDYTNRKIAEIERLAGQPKCKDAKRRAVDEAKRISPSAGDAIDGADCGTAVAVKDPDPKEPKDPVKPPKDPVKPPKDPPDNGGEDAGKDGPTLTAEAREAAKSGQWGKALRLCEAAASKDRGDQDNAMVCAIAACNIKSAGKAKKHIDRIKSPTRKGMARQQCLKNGVDVPID